MDLVNFTEGVQIVRIPDSEQPSINQPTAKRFVPLGESVIQHTEKLFTIHTTGESPLESLILPDLNINIDPQAYDSLAKNTYSALQTLQHKLLSSKGDMMIDTNHQTESTIAKNLNESSPSNSAMKTVRQALAVLKSLNQDRHLLQANLTALEKV